MGVPGINSYRNSLPEGVVDYRDLPLDSRIGDIHFQVFIPRISRSAKILRECDLNWDTRTLMREILELKTNHPLFVSKSDSAFNPMYYRILKSYDKSFVSIPTSH